MFRSSCLCCCYCLKHCARWIWNTEVESFFIRRFQEFRWWGASWIVSFLKFYFIIIYFFPLVRFSPTRGSWNKHIWTPGLGYFFLHFILFLSYFIFSLKLKVLRVAPCKVIPGSIGFWTPRCGFRIPETGLLTPCQWSLDSGFHKQNFCRNPVTLKRCFSRAIIWCRRGRGWWISILVCNCFSPHISILLLEVLCFFRLNGLIRDGIRSLF